MTRARSREALAFGVATALVLVHAIDDAFAHRQPGVDLGQHAIAAGVAAAGGIAGIAAFGRLRPGLRSALAFAFGSLALVNGLLHVVHVATEGPAASDITGLVATAAGAALLGMAVAIPWRHRGEGAATPARRWARRAIAIPGALVALVVLVVPVGAAIVETHKWRSAIGDPPSAAYAAVSFRSTDGLDIAGWYRPSQNGASVLVVHGGGSDRMGAVVHAEMLASHGYGVLLYDARGRGESEGSPNSYGWDWTKDAAGALDFLGDRDDVRDGRIGAVGLSTGADILIEVAAEREDVRALVTDGAAAGSFEDGHRLNGFHAATPSLWVMFKAMAVLSGDGPGTALEEAVPRISSPLLLVSAGRELEYDFNVRYAAVAGDRAEHWNLPDAHHTDALREHASAYEQRVVGFLDEALLAAHS
jgi:uncharacterized protein